MTETLTLKQAKPSEQDFKSAMEFMSHLEILARDLRPESNASGSHRWYTIGEDYKEDFAYCTIDGQIDFEAFIQHWDKAMPGSLFRIVHTCSMLVPAVCSDNLSYVSLDVDKIEAMLESED